MRLRTAVTLARLAPQLVFFRMMKRRISLERLAQWAWKGEPPNGTAIQGNTGTTGPRAARYADEEARVIACVVRLHQLLGGRDDDCVPRSLLLYRELSRLGADPRLCVGFKPAEGGVVGHAWVEVAGRAVGEADPVPAGFNKQLVFGEGGRERSNGTAI